ncbi:TPA: Asp23/Gls24 family envelope stress response protein [Streptococcus agalactiae]
MTVKINTRDGQIELSDDVIATVVGGSTTEIFGVVGMASKSAIKDNFQALLRKENYAKGVVVWSSEAGIAVDVYTVMSYGVKISEVSKNIQERVKFNLENQLGLSADMVNVYVQSIKVVGED